MAPLRPGGEREAIVLWHDDEAAPPAPETLTTRREIKLREPRLVALRGEQEREAVALLAGILVEAARPRRERVVELDRFRRRRELAGGSDRDWQARSAGIAHGGRGSAA